MTTPKVSILIPSRNERYLARTVQDVLTQARGDVECIVVLEGYHDHQLPTDDKRLVVLHHGSPKGMRQSINEAASVAHGDYLLKLDAHCALDEGYDLKLLAYAAPHAVQVPRRYSLDAEGWTRMPKTPIDAHYLSYPWEAHRTGDGSMGLHGTVWKDRAAALAKEESMIASEMSSQGSCWFMAKSFWKLVIGPLDHKRYGNFIQEFQEIGMKAWLSGGQVLVNKHTWYAHLHKGKSYTGLDGKQGRGYFISTSEQTRGTNAAIDYWMFDRWPEAKRKLRWFVEVLRQAVPDRLGAHVARGLADRSREASA